MSAMSWDDIAALVLWLLAVWLLLAAGSLIGSLVQRVERDVSEVGEASGWHWRQSLRLHTKAITRLMQGASFLTSLGVLLWML